MSSRLSFFLGQVWWYARKERVLGGGDRKTKLRGRGGIESIVSIKTDIRCLCLWLGFSQHIIYSIFLCLLFYKQILYFISYQMNKSNIFLFFLQTIILINNIISPYLFYYKKPRHFLKLYFLTKKFNLYTKNGMLHSPMIPN